MPAIGVGAAVYWITGIASMTTLGLARQPSKEGLAGETLSLPSSAVGTLRSGLVLELGMASAGLLR